MMEQSYENKELCRSAGSCRLTVNHIFCGAFSGRWQSAMASNRLIYIFESGKETSIIEDSDGGCRLLPGTWLFIPAQHRVRHDQRPGLRLISIHFNVEIHSHIELFAGCIRLASGHAPKMRTTFRKFISRDGLLNTVFGLQSVLWGMLEKEILPQFPEAEQRRNRCRSFTELLETISSDPRKNLSVVQMAALMKMGRENFVKRFSTETGESPKAFFNRIRAAAIARELGDPAIPVSEIAEHFGFTDVFYFSRFFKRYFGLGPAAYRKQLLVQGPGMTGK